MKQDDADEIKNRLEKISGRCSKNILVSTTKKKNRKIDKLSDYELYKCIKLANFDENFCIYAPDIDFLGRAWRVIKNPAGIIKQTP